MNIVTPQLVITDTDASETLFNSSLTLAFLFGLRMKGSSPGDPMLTALAKAVASSYQVHTHISFVCLTVKAGDAQSVMEHCCVVLSNDLSDDLAAPFASRLMDVVDGTSSPASKSKHMSFLNMVLNSNLREALKHSALSDK